MKNFNGLSAAETERLSILAEECGEVIHIVGKILRHGYESFNPKSSRVNTNRFLLEKELGDIQAIHRIMSCANDIRHEKTKELSLDKIFKLKRYIHHNAHILEKLNENNNTTSS